MVTRVQGNSAQPGSFGGVNTVVAVTLGSAVTSGNTICGGFGIDGGEPVTIVSFTDDKGNTPNIETQAGSGGLGGTAFSLSNITNGPITFTLTVAGATGLTLIVDEFSGTSTAATDSRDSTAHGGQFQAAPGTGTDNVSSGNFTTVTNGDLLYSFTANTNDVGGNATLTPGTGYSAATSSTFTAFTNLQSNSAWMVQTTAGSGTAATWTQSQNDGRATFLVAIKAAAGGGDTFANTGQIHFI